MPYMAIFVMPSFLIGRGPASYKVAFLHGCWFKREAIVVMCFSKVCILSSKSIAKNQKIVSDVLNTIFAI